MKFIGFGHPVWVNLLDAQKSLLLLCCGFMWFFEALKLRPQTIEFVPGVSYLGVSENVVYP